MLISFPKPPPGPMGQYLGQVLAVLRQALLPAISAQEATPQVILRSPNGTSYSVTVSDAGVLEVNVNDGKTRP
jgi:hypothetical protein